MVTHNQKDFFHLSLLLFALNYSYLRALYALQSSCIRRITLLPNTLNMKAICLIAAALVAIAEADNPRTTGNARSGSRTPVIARDGILKCQVYCRTIASIITKPH